MEKQPKQENKRTKRIADAQAKADALVVVAQPAPAPAPATPTAPKAAQYRNQVYWFVNENDPHAVNKMVFVWLWKRTTHYVPQAIALELAKIAQPKAIVACSHVFTPSKYPHARITLYRVVDIAMEWEDVASHKVTTFAKNYGDIATKTVTDC